MRSATTLVDVTSKDTAIINDILISLGNYRLQDESSDKGYSSSQSIFLFVRT